MALNKLLSTGDDLHTSKLISLNDPKSPITEAYRTLRTNIQYASVDKPLRRILITSSSPGEGKSTIAANLAITLAQADYSVILMDCDLRLPTLHKKFGYDNFYGLTKVLFERVPVEQVLWTTSLKNLKVLGTGPLPPNPSEVLASKKMQDFLNYVQGLADYVIIDSPPVLAVTDAAILATKCDGVVLTIEKGKTKIDAAKKAKELLDNVNAKILGTVLNKVEAKESSYYYYYDEKGKKKG